MKEAEFAEVLLNLARQEKKIRAETIKAPDFWRGDLTRLHKIHAEIAERMDSYIEHWGWPGGIAVGWHAADASAYLASHCVTQPKFMRRCLPFIEQAYRFGDTNGVSFAILYDAIMYFEGKPQVYGSYLDWSRDGKILPWRTVDVKNVDKRRAAMLLEPLAQYLRTKRKDLKAECWQKPKDIERYRAGVVKFALAVGWERVHP